MFQSWIIFLKGFLTCASLIVAIGAQTSFVLRQRILRSHIFLTAVTCLICDAVLICAGIFGIGSVVALNPIIEKFICLAGVHFLIWFGLRALLRALQGTSALAVDEGAGRTARRTILAGLGISLLNGEMHFAFCHFAGSLAAIRYSGSIVPRRAADRRISKRSECWRDQFPAQKGIRALFHTPSCAGRSA